MKKLSLIILILTIVVGSGAELLLAQQEIVPRPIERYFMINYDKAFLTLDNAVNDHPQSALALLRRGEFKRLSGMTQAAQEDFRLANRLNPYAADLYRFNGPYSLLNVLSSEPELATLGLSLDRRMGYYYKMIDLQYLKEEVDEMEVNRIELVISQIEELQWENALKQIDTLLAAYPNSAIGHDLQGVILTKQEQYNAAADAFTKAVTIQPDFAIAWYNFSKLEKARGNTQAATAHLDQAIHLQEDLTKAYFDRAQLRKAQGDRNGALEDYNKVIELQGEAYLEAYLNRGLTRKLLGDFDGALADLNKAVAQFPEHAELYKNRGNLYLLFGDYDYAIRDYDHAIELKEDFAEVYYNRGLAHLIRYDNEAGCADLERSVELGFTRAAEKKTYFCSKQLKLPQVGW